MKRSILTMACAGLISLSLVACGGATSSSGGNASGSSTVEETTEESATTEPEQTEVEQASDEPEAQADAAPEAEASSPEGEEHVMEAYLSWQESALNLLNDWAATGSTSCTTRAELDAAYDEVTAELNRLSEEGKAAIDATDGSATCKQEYKEEIDSDIVEYTTDLVSTYETAQSWAS